MHSWRPWNYFGNLALSFLANKEKNETPLITTHKCRGRKVSFLRAREFNALVLEVKELLLGVGQVTGTDTYRPCMGKEL